jgi:hypothetical protein
MKVRVTEDGIFISKKFLYGIEIAEIKKEISFYHGCPRS